MPRLVRFLRRPKALYLALASALAALGAVALVSPAALAHDGGSGAVPPPPANPTSADQIQNVDQVKTAIKVYYGDTASNVPDPVSGTTTLHFASASSAYAKEMAGIEAQAARYLADPYHGRQHVKHHGHHGMKAIVLDVDDTTLNTYDYEIYSNFVYNPTTNAAFVNAGAFPAVFGMPQLVSQAEAEGYTIFWLTGRPESQRGATVDNLTSVGYPAPDAAQMFLRNKDNPPAYLPCEPTCTTDQYKSLTRAHIEALGYDIVGNFGDQYSDLSYGHEDRAFKLPNPMYFLP